MPLQIIRGRRNAPIRGVLYATAGFGKSALAATLPSPVFIDIEGSTERYDVARIDARTEGEVLHALKELVADQQGFKTVVLDTIDWLESAIADAICREQKVKTIADASGGYGKGYVEVGRRIGAVLGLCDQLVSKGVNILLIAHSIVKKVSPPDQIESYDRYELALDQKNCALPVCEWAELVLFGKFETTLVKTKEKKIKADLGEQSRLLYTTNTAAWYAKNRFALPPELTIPAAEFGATGQIPAAILPPELAAIFSGKVAITSAVAAGAVAAAKSAEPAARITAEQIEKLTGYAKNSVAGPVIEKALEHYKALEIAELTEAEAAKVITRCQEEMNSAAEAAKKPAEVPATGVAAKFPWGTQPVIAAWLETNATKVEAFAATKGWIKAGQSWKDIPGEHAERIISKCDAFATAAGIPALKKQEAVAA